MFRTSALSRAISVSIVDQLYDALCVGALCCRSGDVCIAAAAKPGGSPPKILARVLTCCGRFFELLLPEGAERMQRLRDEQQAQS